MYAFGHISGGHFNPAVTIGLATARRFPWSDAVAYIVTQVIAAVVAAGGVWLIAINQQDQTTDALSAAVSARTATAITLRPCSTSALAS